jgi:acetoin utilization deacetylase AcuC-like enzyme
MVYRQLLWPVALEFRPEMVMVSAGQDAHRGDPLGGMNLSTKGFGAMAGVVKEIADTCCPGRLMATLEGGYNLDTLSDSVVAVLQAFQGQGSKLTTVEDPRVAKRIEEVKAVQKAYWSCFG